MTIAVLRPDVASKIAAGEVIERPASVVKELVENSLDAGACRVDVDVSDGGLTRLRVVDDGIGIEEGDLKLAFLRFATSKVVDLSDLEDIRTLGFRGEALASIAAVSRVRLITKTKDAAGAISISVNEGTIGGVSQVGAPDGTSVTVESLFESFPARRKFLASPSAETGRIRSLVQRYSRANPQVAFQLIADGKSSVSTSGSGRLIETVAEVYSSELASQMLEIDAEGDGYLSVEGLVGSAAAARARRGGISIFVNGRWIQPGRLGHAVEQAYAGFIAQGKYPFAVVFVSVDPGEIDVNVHPAKSEIRFRDERKAYGALQRAIRGTLTKHSPVPEMHQPNVATPGFATGAPAQDSRASVIAGAGLSSRPVDVTEGLPLAASGSLPMISVLPVMRVLGQSQLTYVIAEGPGGLFVIDQHAAHERVVYESLAAHSGPAVSQSLMVPLEVDLADLEPELADALADSQGLLVEAGFSIEPFGPAVCRITALPAAMGAEDAMDGLMEALRAISSTTSPAERRESIRRSVACHGSVRAGMKMSLDEMEELTRLLEKCKQPHSCPHGRPTVMHLSEEKLAREFRRI